MNTLLNGLKENANIGLTQNGAITRKTTGSKVYDLFAQGAAYRFRPIEDKILLFKEAYEEDADLAMKCLFYIRDILGGQGERQFFKDCMNWLAETHPESAKKNLEYIADFGRWDDLYAFVDTKLEFDALGLFAKQLFADSAEDYPSLAAKWAASENTSSPQTRALGKKTRERMGLTSRGYRKLLSSLRKRLNVLERLMSAGEWDKIEFDKIPSKAGIQYRQAFMRHDISRPKGQTYEEFIKSEDTKVNAKALYPYEVVRKAADIVGAYNYCTKDVDLNDVERLVINKYWDNLTDYFQDKVFNGLCMVDTSGSMIMTCEGMRPLDVAISLGMYCAERAAGPFHNHFLTFESYPNFIEIQGVDFCDKVKRIAQAGWHGSTNIEAAFDLLLNTALENNCTQEDLPQNLLIVSDMQFNAAIQQGDITNTLMENIKKKWEAHGYTMPHLVFWNVNAFSLNNVPMKTVGNITYVSGASPIIFDMLLSGKTGYDLMIEKLSDKRYENIVA